MSLKETNERIEKIQELARRAAFYEFALYLSKNLSPEIYSTISNKIDELIIELIQRPCYINKLEVLEINEKESVII